MHLFIKYGTVFLGSMFKFIIGPISGTASGLTTWETAVFTILGMMTSVVIFSVAGKQARSFWMQRVRRHATPKPLFSSYNRRIVYIWRRFGLQGIAFFTPVVFSPILGTILAVSFGEPPRRILPAMLVSALFWGLALTWAVHLAGMQAFG